MIGDTVDDISSAVSADRSQRASLAVLGLGIPPPGHSMAARASVVEALYLAGAARVLRSLNELEEIVLKRPTDIYSSSFSPSSSSSPSSSVASLASFLNGKSSQTEAQTSTHTHVQTSPLVSVSSLSLSSLSSPPSSFSLSAFPSFPSIVSRVGRYARLERVTKETQVIVELNLDGTGQASISSGIGYLDHMLHALTKHSSIDLSLVCKGDLEIDDHHSTEDCGLTLGAAFAQALGDKKGITRFGSAYAPLDESLARAVVDISGRAFAHVKIDFKREMIGEVSTEMLIHFIVSLTMSAAWTVHVDLLRGSNDHHKAESSFKALAQAIRQAIKRSGSDEVPSTKGSL